MSISICRKCGNGKNTGFCCGGSTLIDERHEIDIEQSLQKSIEAQKSTEATWEDIKQTGLNKQALWLEESQRIAKGPISDISLDRILETLSVAITHAGKHAGIDDLRDALKKAESLAKQEFTNRRKRAV